MEALKHNRTSMIASPVTDVLCDIFSTVAFTQSSISPAVSSTGRVIGICTSTCDPTTSATCSEHGEHCSSGSTLRSLPMEAKAASAALKSHSLAVGVLAKVSASLKPLKLLIKCCSKGTLGDPSLESGETTGSVSTSSAASSTGCSSGAVAKRFVLRTQRGSCRPSAAAK
jgi:hypothetical protein